MTPVLAACLCTASVAFWIGCVVAYCVVISPSVEAFREEVERASRSRKWVHGLPERCVVEGVAIDGQQLLTSPLPAEMLHARHGGFSQGYVVQYEARAAVTLRLENGASQIRMLEEV